MFSVKVAGSERSVTLSAIHIVAITTDKYNSDRTIIYTVTEIFGTPEPYEEVLLKWRNELYD